MDDYVVGDHIEVHLPAKAPVRGIITKVIAVPMPPWSQNLPGYTVIKYKTANGEDGVCSNNSPCLRKLSVLDLLAEVGDDG